MPKPRQSASRTNAGLIGLLAILLLSIGVWIGYDQMESRARILAEREDAALQTSKIIAQALTSFFLSTNYVLSDVIGSVNEDDLHYPSDDPEATERLNALLKRKADTVPAVSGIAVFNSDCVLTARAAGGGLGFKLDDGICRRIAEAPTNVPHVEIVSAQTAPTGKAGILLNRALPPNDGKFMGGITAGVGLSFLQKWLESFPRPPEDSLTIVDTSRVLIARSPPLPEEVGKRSSAKSFQHVFESGLAQFATTTVSPRDGRERIFGMSRTEGFPFYVIVGSDRTRALDEWRRRAVQVWIGYAALVLLIGLLVRSHRLAVRQRELLAQQATTDELTKISNRRHFLDVGRKEIERAIRYRRPLSLLFIDIDHFKHINDTWGHQAGDIVLRQLAQEVSASLRRQDTVARIGGEEFAILLPETETATAAKVADSLRIAIEKSSAPINSATEIKYTLSIGVASLDGEDDTLDDLMRRADKALYAAKDSGRNRVTVG